MRNFIGVLLAALVTLSAAHAKPVIHLDGKPVFELIAREGARYGPEERAQIVERRLASFADSAVPVSEIRSEETDGATDVVAGDQRLVTVTDADAATVQRPRAEIADGYT